MKPFVPARGGGDPAALPGGSGGFVGTLLARLRGGEWQLVRLMVAEGVWTGPPPAAADAPPVGGSDIEWGTVLFLLNHPHLIADEAVRLLADAFVALLPIVGHLLPPSALPPAQYARLAAHRVIEPGDGSLLGTGPYELFDQRWLLGFFNLVRSVVEGRVHNGGRFVPPAPPVTIVPRGGRVRLALVSDWGTGTPAARGVIAALAATDPDAAVHLGDVYYSGTPNAGPFEPAGEEADKLLAPWPRALAGRSFALNSNHEMYSGALGYFAALVAEGSPFAAQGESSAFALCIADWTVLGLDSALHSDPLGLYMTGALERPGACAQTDWIRALAPDPARTIVLTHHNAVDAGCDPAQQNNYAPLWASLRAALGGDPYAWYWGHIHNAIAYADPLRIGAFATATRCRCLGHGALPYGFASALAGNAQVTWQASTRAGVGDELRNGFVTVDFMLGADGTVATVTDRFHDGLAAGAVG